MTKRISERARWVQVARIPQPDADASWTVARHNEAKLVLDVIAKLGKVVRAERDQWGGIVFKARKS